MIVPVPAELGFASILSRIVGDTQIEDVEKQLVYPGTDRIVPVSGEGASRMPDTPLSVEGTASEMGYEIDRTVHIKRELDFIRGLANMSDDETPDGSISMTHALFAAGEGTTMRAWVENVHPQFTDITDQLWVRETGGGGDCLFHSLAFGLNNFLDSRAPPSSRERFDVGSLRRMAVAALSVDDISDEGRSPLLDVSVDEVRRSAPLARAVEGVVGGPPDRWDDDSFGYDIVRGLRTADPWVVRDLLTAYREAFASRECSSMYGTVFMLPILLKLPAFDDLGIVVINDQRGPTCPITFYSGYSSHDPRLYIVLWQVGATHFQIVGEADHDFFYFDVYRRRDERALAIRLINVMCSANDLNRSTWHHSADAPQVWVELWKRMRQYQDRVR